MRRWSHPAFIVVTLLCGLAIRHALRGHVSDDASEYLIPWYGFARAHGLASLRTAFTNYPPYYSYLLLLITQVDRWAAPLTLIKGISCVFELGCAVLAASLTRRLGGRPWAAAWAFAAVWLAPTVLFNGAYWAQADSLWTFFILLSLRLFLGGGNGVPAFAVAFSIKSQSAFLGPFLLGMIGGRRVHWLWLAAVPAVYLLIAVPVLLEGRPLVDVLSIYLDQANTYRGLSRNAANPWIFASMNEGLGVAIGLMVAAIAGVYLAWRTARIDRADLDGLMLAAAASLMLMPFLLPKMHDRYFYAFELVAIVLACRNPRYIGMAVMAQANGLLSYLMFERHFPLQILTPAAICNATLALLLMVEIGRPARPGTAPCGNIAAFTAAAVALTLDMALTDLRRGSSGWYPVCAGGYCLTGVLLSLRIWRGARSAIQSQVVDTPRSGLDSLA